MDSDDDGPSEIELLRMQNIKQMDSFISQKMADPELKIILKSKDQVKRSVRVKRGDENFQYSGAIPLDRKKSARLAKMAPQYTYEDLPDETNIKTEISLLEEDIENFNKVFFKPRRSITSRNVPVPCVAPEDITENYLSRIAFKGFVKTYSDAGTSCHQCRQKTLDSKTYCRSGTCSGVRGQFCGTCLLNRYGEDARIVLKDPNWACPPCRGICNCSICRNRQGKRPTGILAPIAQASGHKSVKDFLISLQGEGDYVGAKPKKQIFRQERIFKVRKCEEVDGDVLLGFDGEFNEVWVGSEFDDVEILGFFNQLPVYRIPDKTIYTDFYKNLESQKVYSSL